MKAYMCLICGFVYNEEEGDPERCPDCGAGKEDFEMVEI
jgi:rubredoxin